MTRARGTLVTLAMLLAGALGMPVRSLAAPAVEHRVAASGGSIHVLEYPGKDPAIVLLHGFPDNTHLYDRLLPHLRGRHVVAFDFIGWGASSRPAGHRYTFDGLTADLDAVMRKVVHDSAVLVGHDASGPPVVDWALAHRDRVAGLVLLNTFYGITPTVDAPDAIKVFSTPGFLPLQRALDDSFAGFSWLFRWQVGAFISDPAIRGPLVARLLRQFRGRGSARPAFLGLNRDLNAAIAAETARQPRLAELSGVPVRIVFGDRDRYLNPGVARSLQALIPGSRLTLLPARHYVQVDRPADVAREIRAVADPR